MSTIATPRDTPLSRRMPSSSQTPTSSSRPSLETVRSITGSPKPNSALASAAGAAGAASAPGTPGTPGGLAIPTSVKRNRAALREYYNLKKSEGRSASQSPSRGAASSTGTPVLEVSESALDQSAAGGGSNNQQQHANLAYSEVAASEMDQPNFDADDFVRRTLQTSGLEALLRIYTRVLGEIRALDAEKKGLVYDNYSRLITATETIRKMRATMDPLNPMAATLDPAMAHIYTQAKALRDAMRLAVPEPGTPAAEAAAARAHARRLAAALLQTPDRLRQLVRDGRSDEAQLAWAEPRRLLQAWRDQGVGGDDVAACLADGDAALRGEAGPAGWSPEV